MNIDERLAALIQSVELIAAIQRDNEARWEKDFGELRAAIQQDAENIRALARIAELHHERLSRIEDQQ